MHCSFYVFKFAPRCLFGWTERRNNRQRTVSRDKSHNLANNDPGKQFAMCWGVQVVSVCELCRTHTPVDEIQWQGCYLEASKGESYPVCSQPTITQELKRYDCQICLTEADDGHSPDDIHPEPLEHPGFPLPAPQIHISQVQLPAPTDYETIQHIENLAGPANELPSYNDTMNESPSSTHYALVRVRDEAIHAGVITYGVHLVTARRHRELRSVATKRIREIRDLRTRITSFDVSTANLLDVADKTIESVLSEQEETVSRVRSLQERLLSIEKDINFEGSHRPSPSDMALLEHQQQSIIRELEEKYIKNFMIPTAEDWDSRLQTLLDHVLVEWRKSLEARFEEMRLWAEELRNSTTPPVQTPPEPDVSSWCCLQ
jgi:hypothetical protein